MSKPPAQLSEDAILAWARLLRSSQTLLSAVEAELKREDLPPLAWYDALLELKRAGRGGLRPFELQQKMLLAQYNLSRLCDRLAEAGYLERRPCREDARGHVLSITPQGRELLRRMWPPYRAAIQRHFAGKLSAGELRGLAAALAKLV